MAKGVWQESMEFLLGELPIGTNHVAEVPRGRIHPSCGEKIKPVKAGRDGEPICPVCGKKLSDEFMGK